MSARFGLEGAEPATLEEVGRMLRISAERVRQLELRALARLRRAAKASDVHRALDEPEEPGDPLDTA